MGKFISFMISNQKEKYGYGYKMGTGRLKRQKIMLPLTSKGFPDFNFMKKYMLIQEMEQIIKIIKKYK